MTNATRIKTTPDPLEPYKISQGFKAGDFIYLSGQAAIDKQGNLVGVDDFDAQAAQVMTNITEILAEAGATLDHVIKVTIYLTDMSNFEKIMVLRGAYFTPPWPADTIVEVKALALPELMIEIDATAYLGGPRTQP
ncbi:MAG: RidA family protein [Pseudomonadota bacterium]